MTSFLLALSLFKIGIYTPAGEAPLGVWPYVSVGVHQKGNYPLGFEVGFTEQIGNEAKTAFGYTGQMLVFRPTYLVGVTKGITKRDLDLAVGAKYLSNQFSPYVGISLKFSSLRRRKHD